MPLKLRNQIKYRNIKSFYEIMCKFIETKRYEWKESLWEISFTTNLSKVFELKEALFFF